MLWKCCERTPSRSSSIGEVEQGGVQSEAKVVVEQVAKVGGKSEAKVAVVPLTTNEIVIEPQNKVEVEPEAKVIVQQTIAEVEPQTKVRVEPETNVIVQQTEAEVKPNLTEVLVEPGTKVQDQSETEEATTAEIDDSFNKMPLQLTKAAPQFKTTAVVNGEFKDVALSDYKGKYVILFFYPLDFTFVCPTEIIAFSERADEFRKIGCEVIAASTDSHFTHLAWINTPRKQGGLGPMNIPIISDKSHSISRDYGVLNEETGIPFRGLFIIDDKQNLRQITINDLPVGRSVDETLRLVQAFQFTDKNGEVCPANWQPGSKTIKPDTKAAQEYFIDAN